jgi:hypothetical protein
LPGNASDVEKTSRLSTPLLQLIRQRLTISLCAYSDAFSVSRNPSAVEFVSRFSYFFFKVSKDRHLTFMLLSPSVKSLAANNYLVDFSCRGASDAAAFPVNSSAIFNQSASAQTFAGWPRKLSPVPRTARASLNFSFALQMILF